MRSQSNEQRLTWMAFGLVAGLCLAYCWPHEVAHAVATDRDDKFAICTVETQTQIGAPETVFVLDFLTGEIYGALLNPQTGTFTNFWYRKLVADFQDQGEEASKAKYAIIPGKAGMPNSRGAQTATSVLYIGEMTSGKIIAYKFNYTISKSALPVQPIEPFAFFPFRKATKE